MIASCQVFKERQAQVETEESKLEHAKAEVEGINETIRQAEAYDKQMKSEIAVTRRETYAAEEAVSKLEKAKQVQDVFIDKMSEEYKTKSEELALYEARLASQRQEASAAAATLSEAVKEMEVIQTEKKQLLMQWQSTLIAVQKRNEALQVCAVAVSAGVCDCPSFWTQRRQLMMPSGSYKRRNWRCKLRILVSESTTLADVA